MTPEQLAVRNATYDQFVVLGRAPTPAEVAAALDADDSAVLSAWRALHDAHALVLDRDGTSIRMANPFSAVPTPHRVEADGRAWFANCAWDAFGILAALHVDGAVETSCPDCQAPLHVTVTGARPDDTSLVFHCLVPATSWWEDIGFT